MYRKRSNERGKMLTIIDSSCKVHGCSLYYSFNFSVSLKIFNQLSWEKVMSKNSPHTNT